MRWLLAALLLAGCATTAPAPVYMCYGTVDGDGDRLTICEPHDPTGYKPVYNTTPRQPKPDA